MENKQGRGHDMLTSFVGITEEQIRAILDGEASIAEDCEYIDAPDESWRAELSEWQEWLREDRYLIAGKWVQKDALGEYIYGACHPLFRRYRDALDGVRHTRVSSSLEYMRAQKLKEIMTDVGLDDPSEVQYYAPFVMELERLVLLFAGSSVMGPGSYGSPVTQADSLLGIDLQKRAVVLDSRQSNYHRKIDREEKRMNEEMDGNENAGDMCSVHGIHSAPVGGELSDAEIRSRLGVDVLLNPAIMDVVKSPKGCVIGDGGEFCEKIANTLALITDLQMKRCNGLISEGKYVKMVSPPCMELLGDFIRAMVMAGAPRGISGRMYDDLEAKYQALSYSSEAEAKKISVVLCFERMRGMIHKDAESSLKFLLIFPITDNILDDREFIVRFFDMLNEDVENAKGMLREYRASGERTGKI